MLTPSVQAVLINTPNNPSGAVYSEETLKNMAALLTKKERDFGHDIWLISDEPYREIAFDGHQVPYVSLYYPRTISCYSFSKSLSVPGERIGYVAVNPASGVSALLVNMCGQISAASGITPVLRHSACRGGLLRHDRRPVRLRNEHEHPLRRLEQTRL